MATIKQGLLNALKALGVEADPKAKNKELAEMLNKAKKDNARLVPEAKGNGDEGRLQPPSDVHSSAEGDYLRQYQYRKQTPFGSKESDPQLGSKAAKMKEHLLSQDKVRIFVPRALGESPLIKQSVCLNGYRLDLPKQAYLEVPMQVAEVIMDSLSQTEAAIIRGQISGDAAKEYALL